MSKGNHLYFPLPSFVHAMWGKATLRLDFMGFLLSWLVLLKKIPTTQDSREVFELTFRFLSGHTFASKISGCREGTVCTFFSGCSEWLKAGETCASGWDVHSLVSSRFLLWFFPHFFFYSQNLRPWKKYLSPMENSEIQLAKIPHSSSVKEWLNTISGIFWA